jgi:drug/metabolite transporter (DMT)-like permease
MTRHPRLRRALSFIAMAAGAILILFAPDNAWVGIVMVILGAAIELLGIVLRHKRDGEES